MKRQDKHIVQDTYIEVIEWLKEFVFFMKTYPKSKTREFAIRDAEDYIKDLQKRIKE